MILPNGTEFLALLVLRLLVPQNIGSLKPASKQYFNNMAISEEEKQAGACVTEVLFHHRDFEAVESSSAAFCWKSKKKHCCIVSAHTSPTACTAKFTTATMYCELWIVREKKQSSSMTIAMETDHFGQSTKANQTTWWAWCSYVQHSHITIAYTYAYAYGLWW